MLVRKTESTSLQRDSLPPPWPWQQGQLSTHSAVTLGGVSEAAAAHAKCRNHVSCPSQAACCAAAQNTNETQHRQRQEPTSMAVHTAGTAAAQTCEPQATTMCHAAPTDPPLVAWCNRQHAPRQPAVAVAAVFTDSDCVRAGVAAPSTRPVLRPQQAADNTDAARHTSHTTANLL